MDKRHKKFIFMLIIVIVSLSAISAYILISEHVFDSYDGKLIHEIETNGYYNPNSEGIDKLKAAIELEEQSKFNLHVESLKLKNAMGEDDGSLLIYVDETNRKYKEIIDLRTQYRFGNITTEEFKNKINEYYNNGNPLLKKIISPL